MVKSTVRFSEAVVDEVEALVEEGYFESKSEFYRFASDYLLELMREDYEPQTLDFESIKSEAIPDTKSSGGGRGPEAEIPFFESMVIVRKYALRGRISDAEDFIDHHYDPADRHGMFLEELLGLYRTRRQPQSTEPQPRYPPADAPRE